jgi:hypothetical protein
MRIECLVFLSAVLVASACAHEAGAPPGTSDFDGNGGPDGGGGGASSDVAGFGEVVPPPSNDSCSADLQSVVDDKGNVVATCPPDQGCYDGRCISAACDAAGKSHGSVGCDFVVSTPTFYADDGGPCYAVFLANAWGKPVHITASYAGQALDVTKFGRIPDGTPNAAAWPAVPASGVPVNEVAVLFMSGDPNSRNGDASLACPVPPAIAQNTAVPNATWKGTAFHITTDVPVSAYDILPYGGAASFLPGAQMVLPTTAWGTNYIAAMPPLDAVHGGGPQWAHIVAKEDNTTIKIVPTAALPSGPSIPGGAEGALYTVSLNANEFLQFEPCFIPCAGSVNFPHLEISGSVLQSDKPIAFVSGNAYMCEASATSPQAGGCDSDHESIPPVSALGSEYVAAPYATRRANMQPESIPYRIVGAVDGTTLTFDPPVPGAPATLAQGQLVDFESTKAFVVTSQDNLHPFYVGQSMPGGLGMTREGITTPLAGGDPGLGDEEFVSVVPPAQFLQKYVFFTDPTYGTTNLVVTRTKTANGFRDVKIDCLGNVTGFVPVGSRYEIAAVDIKRVADVGTCKNGQHVATSDGPFGLVVWGVDTYASYAYPAGGNVAAINQVVVPPVPR